MAFRGRLIGTAALLVLGLSALAAAAGSATFVTKPEMHVYHYDITATGTLHFHDDPGDGTTDSTFNWTITWKDVAFSVYPSRAGLFFVPADKHPPLGEFRATAGLTNTVPDWGICRYTVTDLPVSRAGTAAFGGIYPPSEPRFSFSAGSEDWQKYDDLLLAAEQAHCHGTISNGPNLGLTPGGDTFSAADGTEYTSTPTGVVIQNRSAQKLPHPLELLREGKAFTIDSGDHVQCGPTCSETYDDHFVIRFKPRGKLKVTKLKLYDIDPGKNGKPQPLEFLSVSNDYNAIAYHTNDQGLIFGGNTMINGTLTITGEPKDKLASVELELLEHDQVVATAELTPKQKQKLLNKPFGADKKIEITSLPSCPPPPPYHGDDGCLFHLPVSEASKVDLTHDGQLTVRVRAVTDKGEEAERTYGSVTKLVRYLGTNRYGGRDLKYGGDDWIRPSKLDLLQHYAGSHCYGDMSNMNGGYFDPHGTHVDGVDVDVKFNSPTACSASAHGGSFDHSLASDAQRTIADLNDLPWGSRLLTVYVLFHAWHQDLVPTDYSGPFWNTIKGVQLSDGRRVCRVIKNMKGHDTHMHWRIDYQDTKLGRCPGDPGMPP